MTVFLYRRGAKKRTFRIVASEDNKEVLLELPHVTFTGFTPQHTCLSALIAAWKYHKKKLSELGFKATKPSSIVIYEYHGQDCVASYTLPRCHKDYIARTVLT